MKPESKLQIKQASVFRIFGSDLGVSFIHQGKLYFLFGDTNRRDPDTGLPASAFPGEDFNEKSY